MSAIASNSPAAIRVTKAALLHLVQPGQGPCLSVYLPAMRSDNHSTAPIVRCKNLVRQGAGLLLDRGMAAEETIDLLKPIDELLDSPDEWRTSGHGWALFVQRNRIHRFSLADQPEELVVAGDSFHITPLIAPAFENQDYYLLALSQNRVRLLRGNRDAIEVVAVPGLPASLKCDLGETKPEHNVQAHTSETHSLGAEAAILHGHSAPEDFARSRIRKYLADIDRAVAATLGNSEAPLIFSGVNYLYPIYREVNSYRGFMVNHLSGNPDQASAAELRARAWKIINVAIKERKEAMVARYWNLVAHGRVSNDPELILRAAHTGIVEALFIDPRLRRLGRFCRQSGQLHLNDADLSGSEDLVNLAATLVLRHRGEVVDSTGHVPGGGLMAAVLRYAPPS